jgi:hypothetical protein
MKQMGCLFKFSHFICPVRATGELQLTGYKRRETGNGRGLFAQHPSVLVTRHRPQGFLRCSRSSRLSCFRSSFSWRRSSRCWALFSEGGCCRSCRGASCRGASCRGPSWRGAESGRSRLLSRSSERERERSSFSRGLSGDVLPSLGEGSGKYIGRLRRCSPSESFLSRS